MLLSDFWDYYIRQEARNKKKAPPNLFDQRQRSLQDYFSVSFGVNELTMLMLF